ncbi:FAD/NAD(P)-binding protein [Natrialba sp. SSL1]|uniref:FAD/NAD(P)-binding protein n=1 Tax=Natrialba sp. SSL1 TaxID=1869245 RepID=UPI0008F94CEB|nr:FAD/NAD(P)-binding protein [Natrialba sp. SSL1]OIB56324.1 thioredoxin reductase [Natrialba sp. SSL1]
MNKCVIVGGGIHGTYCCQRLLDDTDLTRDDLCIVDPHEQLLESFRQKARACDMEALRSTFVHHVGTDPFGLESFAEARDREDELLPRPSYPRRPSLSLFLDYAEFVIDRTGIDDLHQQATVTSIRRDGSSGPLVVETTDRAGRTSSIRTRTCVLAIGPGDRYRRPSWADGVESITHVWDDDFDPARARDEQGKTIVVGGGVTAAQLARCLAEHDGEPASRTTESADTTLLSRHDLETAAIEADPHWINWNHIERQLHRHPPGSKARYDTIQAARNDGTVPPTVADQLESAVDAGSLQRRQGTVRSARTAEGRVRLLLADGGCLTGDRVVLATGFEPVFDHPFVDRLARELELECGHRGLPVLDDETLAWMQTDGSKSALFATGALAAGTVGSFAANIAGARRAADRLTASVPSAAESASSGAHTEAAIHTV